MMIDRTVGEITGEAWLVIRSADPGEDEWGGELRVFDFQQCTLFHPAGCMYDHQG